MRLDPPLSPAERAFHRPGFGFVNTFDAEVKRLLPLHANLGGVQSLSATPCATRLSTDMDDASLLFYRKTR